MKEKEKVNRWTFRLTQVVQGPADEESARRALARILGGTPNDAAQQARLEKVEEVAV